MIQHKAEILPFSELPSAGQVEALPPGHALPFGTERRSLDSLVPFARNSRTHSPEQIAQIAASIREWGFTNPILIDEHHTILAGHGRLAAAQKLGMADVPVIVARGWTDAQKRAYVIADNKLAMSAGWDMNMLATELKDLALGGFDIGTTGFDDKEYAALLGDLSDAEEQVKEDSVLDRMKVTIEEPRRLIKHRDRWVLAERHVLICCNVIDEWQYWRNDLKDDHALFVPYPGIYSALGKKARTHNLVLVQPDPYVAGHILDRFEEAHGVGCVRLEAEQDGLYA